MTREEAINEIKSWAIPSEKGREVLKTLIPELAESEDERIRRTLVEYFGPKVQIDFVRGIPIQKIRNWLGKQKEQIPYTDFVIKPHKGDDNNPYDMGVSEAQEYAIKRGFGVPFNDGEVYVDERHLTQTIGNILRWADEHPKEQKPIPANLVGLEEAAKDYAILPMDVGDGLVCIDRKKERAFIAGAEWGIKSQEKKIADAYEKGKQEGIRIVRSWESSPGQCGY